MQLGLWTDETLIDLMLPHQKSHSVKVFFVTVGNKDEIEVIRRVKPPCLLLSYFYFRNKPLKKFIDQIGYQPEILLDSGAYSAWTTGKNLSPLDYMKYIRENRRYIHHYVTLDVVGDPDVTWYYYEIMRVKKFRPIPVYHFGTSEEYLQWYIEDGAQFIALGGIVAVRSKKKVANWVSSLIRKYPTVKFHALGTSSQSVLGINGLYSCDSASWIIRAANGDPAWIQGKSRHAKIKRAIYHMRLLTG